MAEPMNVEAKKQPKKKEEGTAAGKKLKEPKELSLEDYLQCAVPTSKICEFFNALSPSQEELSVRVKFFTKKKQAKEQKKEEEEKKEQEEHDGKKEKKRKQKRSQAAALSLGKATSQHFRKTVIPGCLKNPLLEAIKQAATDGESQIDRYVVAKAIRRSLANVVVANNGEHAFPICVL